MRGRRSSSCRAALSSACLRLALDSMLTTVSSVLLTTTVVSALATPKNVVRVTDAASGRPVVLVGTMHYNPHSVAVVQGTVAAVARQRGLHAAAIELCESRWNSTAAARWRDKRLQELPSHQRVLSEDEFQVAWESAVACGLHDVVLADQAIGTTGKRLIAALASTAVDLLTPAGWRRVAADLRAAQALLPSLSSASASGALLAGVPLAVARYLYQSPSALPFVLVSTAALAVAAAIDEATGAVATWDDAVVSALVALVVGRAGYVSLIQERDQALAINIRDACLAKGDAGASRAVVAVVGMAHLAGLQSALQRDEIASTSGERAGSERTEDR